MIKRNLRGTLPSGGELSQRFKGIAAILAERADTSGRFSTHYTVKQSKSDEAEAFDSFRMCILYDTQARNFVVLQSFDAKPYRNSFLVNENGEILSFCDHIPSKPIVETILSGGRIPTTFKPFDLELHSGPNAVQAVSEMAVDSVQKLERYGKLDKNLNPQQWKGRGS